MPALSISRELVEVIQKFGSEPFSTLDFIEEFTPLFPETWEQLLDKYGKGGQGAGSYYTVYSYVAQQLGVLANQGIIERLGYRPAPDSWGNRIIMYWGVDGQSENKAIADPEDDIDDTGTDNEPAMDDEFREGSVKLRTHLRKERHWRLAKAKKEAFINEHGKLTCERCQLDPEAKYGSINGRAVIEVHHTKPVKDMEPNAIVLLSDLQCLCANCHRVAHSELRMLSAI